jgi:DNA-binding NtrC family response regulator
MKRVLLIEDQPMICDLIADCFGERFSTEVVCARSGVLGARMIAGSHFDLAIIDLGLPQISGLELAAYAANENIPMLLVSGHPGGNEKLQRLGYPYLEQPFGLDALHQAALRVIHESRENIRRVQSSARKMLAGKEALSAAVTEARRLLAEIKAQHQARETASDPAQERSPERSGDTI